MGLTSSFLLTSSSARRTAYFAFSRRCGPLPLHGGIRLGFADPLGLQRVAAILSRCIPAAGQIRAYVTGANLRAGVASGRFASALRRWRADDRRDWEVFQSSVVNTLS